MQAPGIKPCENDLLRYKHPRCQIPKKQIPNSKKQNTMQAPGIKPCET